MPSGCGADTLANELATTVLADEVFSIPDVDLDSTDFQIPDFTGGLIVEPIRLLNDDLTTGVVDGTGTFDSVMASVNAHLKSEFEKNRITGEQYTKAYITITESALSNSVQFLLGKDQAYWQSLTARFTAQKAAIGVVQSKVELETAKQQLAATRIEALTRKATYALTKMKLSTEDATYCNLLKQKDLLTAQIAAAGIDNNIKTFTLNNMLPEQLQMLQEQVETQRSQTMDTRTDGTTSVTGTVGKQKDLYDQQIVSYQRDSEVKAAKMFVDAWITMKTIDEGVLPPTGFANTSLDEILTVLKSNNNLV